MFFTSVLVPSMVSPTRRTETFASTRRLPFSISQSEIAAYSSTCLRERRYVRASWGDRKSGPVTISMSGTPQRFRSIAVRFPKATAVDLNRCGVPLIEIVTGPDFRSPQEARAYLLTLKQVLEYAAVSDCDMEKGSLRVDANVSVRHVGETALGTKTEVKNINSFAYVEKALTVERDRQIGILEAGGAVEQQTLLYDSRTNAVRPQRTKEESHDYRYFPDPDLPPLVLTAEFVAEEQAALPELPAKKRERFVTQYALGVTDAAVLTADRAVADYYEAVVRAGAEPKAAANWVMTEVLADAKDNHEQLRVAPTSLAQLIGLVKGGTLSHQAAKRVFAEVAARGGDPRNVAEALGLVQRSEER